MCCFSSQGVWVKPMSTEHKNFLQRTSNGNERATLAIENWPIEETQRQMMSWFLSRVIEATC